MLVRAAHRCVLDVTSTSRTTSLTTSRTTSTSSSVSSWSSTPSSSVRVAAAWAGAMGAVEDVIISGGGGGGKCSVGCGNMSKCRSRSWHTRPAPLHKAPASSDRVNYSSLLCTPTHKPQMVAQGSRKLMPRPPGLLEAAKGIDGFVWNNVSCILLLGDKRWHWRARRGRGRGGGGRAKSEGESPYAYVRELENNIDWLTGGRYK